MHPRISCLLTVVAGWCFTTGCGSFLGGVQAQRDFSVDVNDLEGVDLLIVDTRDGTIDVSVDPGLSGIQVRGTKHARANSLADAEARLNEVHIRAAREGSATLAVRGRLPPQNRYGRGGASMHVVLPSSMNLTLASTNGSILVRGDTGKIRAETSNGSIHIEECRGDVEVRTSNGAIGMSDVRGDIIGSTSNAAIVANGVAGNMEAITSNGPVRLAVDPPPKGRVRASTSNSYVEIEVPRSFGTTLDLFTSNSIVEADLDGFAASDLSVRKTRVRATLNGGGGRVIGRTSNGKVAFRGM